MSRQQPYRVTLNSLFSSGLWLGLMQQFLGSYLFRKRKYTNHRLVEYDQTPHAVHKCGWGSFQLNNLSYPKHISFLTWMTHRFFVSRWHFIRTLFSVFIADWLNNSQFHHPTLRKLTWPKWAFKKGFMKNTKRPILVNPISRNIY